MSWVLWLAPGLAVSFVVGVAASRPLGRALGVQRVVAWALLMAAGLILSATLTPLRSAFEPGTAGPFSCTFTRIGLPSVDELLSVKDILLNVLLFVPLGAVVGWLPRSRLKLAVAVGAIVLPVAIETAQLVVQALDRACESADVVDNLVGLMAGFVVGSVAGHLAHRER